MTIKSLVRRLFRGLGWEVRRLSNANVEEQILKDLLRQTGATIVIDVGANTGQWGNSVFDTGFKGVLVSFEAIPSVHEELVANARKRAGSWKVAPCAALGSKQGKVEFNISANKQSSSVLPMRAAHLQSAPQSIYVEKQVVPMERLDTLAAPLIPSQGLLLLKVDTQGYELEVLKGATGLLSRVVAVQLELSLVELYEGAPTILEMLAFMDSLGFELFNVTPVFKNNSTGRMLQVDGFFILASASR
jgi:FkbM family methyltransferase